MEQLQPLVIVDSRVHVALAGLDSDVAEQLRQLFEHHNPNHAKLKRMGVPAWNEPPIIRTWRDERRDGAGWAKGKGWLSVPRGGLTRVRDALVNAGLNPIFKDHRTTGAAIDFPIPGDELSLYPFQHAAVTDCMLKQNCLLRAPTGSGKTRCGFAFIRRLELPALVIVWSAGLADQWKKRATTELGFKKKDVGEIRGSRVNLRPITIAMSQTLARGVSDEVLDYFGVVIFDEVQRAAARTMFDSVDPFPAKYRLGISADESRKDQKEFLVYDLFGSAAADIKRDALIKSGHVLDVEIRVVPTDFRADWYGLADGEEDDRVLDFKRLLDEMSTDSKRNRSVLACVRWEREEQVLVMSHRREHCLLLDRRLAARGVQTGFLIGGDDYRAEFRRSVDGLERGTLSVGVGTFPAIGQGLDLPSVGVAVCATPIAGNKQFFGQVRGRVCRTSKGKTSARLYYLWDRFVYPRHLKNLIAWNRHVLILDRGKWVEARVWLKKSA